MEFKVEPSSSSKDQKQEHFFTYHLAMIRPFNFHCNEQTVADNIYQQKGNQSIKRSTHQKAIQQFDKFVQILRQNHLKITVVQDEGKNDTPDSIFPNNWVSFHHKNKAIIYPMYAQNRRNQRLIPLISQLQKILSTKIDIIHDYSQFEKQNTFLEGTGSMVLDRQNKILYAVLSQRTHQKMLKKFCQDLGFKLCSFHASQYCHQKHKKIPIYHTNVLMSISSKFVLIGLQLIDNEEQKHKVEQFILKKSKKSIIELTEGQIRSFAGNTLTVINQKGESLLIMSQQAYRSLTQDQISQIQKSTKIIKADLSTIQSNGGGSTRCMLAEVF